MGRRWIHRLSHAQKHAVTQGKAPPAAGSMVSGPADNWIRLPLTTVRSDLEPTLLESSGRSTQGVIQKATVLPAGSEHCNPGPQASYPIMQGTACLPRQLQSENWDVAANWDQFELRNADHNVRRLSLNSRLLYR